MASLHDEFRAYCNDLDAWENAFAERLLARSLVKDFDVISTRIFDTGYEYGAAGTLDDYPPDAKVEIYIEGEEAFRLRLDRLQ